jgi:histone H3/H4
MPRKGEILPRAPIGRIMNKVGAERVSASAINELSEILTEYAEKLSERAIKIAHHSGRKTVKGEDIKLAHKY